MPLPPPEVEREAVHDRRIECVGYRRADGAFEIEGRLTDAKHYSFANAFRGGLAPGEHLHDMSIRMTVSPDFEILALLVAPDAGPYADCAQATAHYASLVGERIKPGFTALTQRRVGGVCGCTHVSELLNRMTTVAFQTIAPLRRAEDGARPNTRLKNTCYAYRADGPVAASAWSERPSGV
ncbi:MAG: DUF2889 domain-containing protein [Pseudomonadota bacterium]